MPPVLAATLRAHPDPDPRAERRDGPRQPAAGRRACSAIATSFAGVLDREPGARRQGDAHRQSGAAGGDRGGRRRPIRRSATRRPASTSSCSAAARARASWPTSCRPRSSGSIRHAAARLSVVQQARERGRRPGRGHLRAARRRGRGRAVLHRPAGADRGRRISSSRARAPRRSPNSRRSAGRRSWCRCRMRSTRTSPPMPACWRRPAARSACDQADFTPDRLAAEIAALAADAGTTRRDGRGRQGRRHRSTPPSGWPISCACGSPDSRNATKASAMKLPRDIGPIHFVGIGGIGMSGIAEVLVNLGYTVQGSDAPTTPTSSGCATRAPRSSIGHAAEQPRRRRGGRGVVRDQARQSRADGGARAAPAGGAPRRDAGRADAAQELRRHRRHPRQDHDDLAGRGAARRRRLRSRP